MTSNWHCGTERVWFVRLVGSRLGNILLEYGERENGHTKISPAQKWLPRPSLAAKNGPPGPILVAKKIIRHWITVVEMR